MKRLILVVFVLALIGAVFVVKYLPWWLSVAIGVAALVTLKFSVRPMLTKLFLLPFKAKGAVLHGATIQVHSLRPVEAPPPAPEPTEGESAEAESEDGLPRQYYELEVTVSPKESSGPFQLWELGELRLVGPKAKAVCDSDDEAENLCTLKKVEVQQEGQFQEDEGLKFPGAQRIRLLLAVRPGVSQLQFRYYFELFGTVQLPGNSAPNLAAA